MPRKSSIRYYATRSAYFTVFNGKQHKLASGPDDQPQGPTFLAALTAFRGLMELSHSDRAGQGNTVRTICELYAQKLEKTDKLRTLKIFLEIASHAVAELGDYRVSDLKPIHVRSFLDKMAIPRQCKKGIYQWTPEYQNFAMRALKAAFGWAVKQEIIEKHSLGAVELEKVSVSKGEVLYIKAEHIKAILEVSNTHFRDLLYFLWKTGARPDEAYHVEAWNYDIVNKCITFPGDPKPGQWAWKNVKKNANRVDRMIYLPDDVATLVEARCKLYPTGRIFRNKLKRNWRAAMVGKSLRTYAKQLGFSPVPTAYGFRHTFATDFLLKGGSISHLASFMGTSIKMIERHYGHTQVDKNRMRSIMLDVMGEKTDKTQEVSPEASVSQVRPTASAY